MLKIDRRELYNRRKKLGIKVEKNAWKYNSDDVEKIARFYFNDNDVFESFFPDVKIEDGFYIVESKINNQ